MSARTTNQLQQKYGAVELKLAYQRNMLMGMAIAFTVYVGAVLSFGTLGREIPRPPVRSPGGGGVIFDGIPLWTPPPIAPQPSAGSSGIRKNIRAGIPVPVSETNLDPDVPAPEVDTQPMGGGRGSGEVEGSGDPEGTGEYRIPEPREAPPEPWVYVEKDPVVVKSVKPLYPVLAMKSGIEGRVLVKLWVGKDGRVREVVVVKSDFEILSEAAVEAAKQFVFTPAYVTGGPVAVWVAIPFDFRLANAR